jgi:hypothetical protein
MRKKNPTTREDYRANHQRMPGDMERKLHGPFKIDMPFEEAVRVGLGRWMPPKLLGVPPERTIEWRQVVRKGVPMEGTLQCPYCLECVETAELHTCSALNRTLMVPHYACRMMRAGPKKETGNKPEITEAVSQATHAPTTTSQEINQNRVAEDVA